MFSRPNLAYPFFPMVSELTVILTLLNGWGNFFLKNNIFWCENYVKLKFQCPSMKSPWTFIGTQPAYLFVCISSMAALSLPWQSWMASTEIVRPTKPRIFTVILGKINGGPKRNKNMCPDKNPNVHSSIIQRANSGNNINATNCRSDKTW